MDQRARDGDFVPVIGLNVDFFKDQVGGLGRGGSVEFFAFQKLVRRVHLVRDVGDCAQHYSRLGKFLAVHFGGGGATDDCPVEFGALAHLQVGTAAVLDGNLYFEDQVARGERIVGLRVA